MQGLDGRAVVKEFLDLAKANSPWCLLGNNFQLVLDRNSMMDHISSLIKHSDLVVMCKFKAQRPVLLKTSSTYFLLSGCTNHNNRNHAKRSFEGGYQLTKSAQDFLMYVWMLSQAENVTNHEQPTGFTNEVQTVLFDK